MRKKCMTAAIIAIFIFFVAAISFLAYITPPKDNVNVFDYPPEFFCKTEENRVDYQTDGKCSAYAAAYVLRHFGEDLNGEELAPEIKRIFGFVPSNSIVNVFKRRGYRAEAVCGSIQTLKQQLKNGNPVIVFIRITGDTHYAVVVGYDERHVYLADSLKKNANASDERYNRVLTTENFENVWKNGTILPDNIYIAVKNLNK